MVSSVNDWRSHTEDDKMETKKFRVEGVSGGHQVQPPARSSTVTNTRSSQPFLWPFLEKLKDIDSTSSPDNYSYPMLFAQNVIMACVVQKILQEQPSLRTGGKND